MSRVVTRTLALLFAVAGLSLPVVAPTAAQGSWTPTGLTGAPAARASHTAVWTGSKMIVWGGQGLTTGAIYDPAADSWTAMSATGAPSPRSSHTAVWTGSKMIVWGGTAGSNTGGVYDPASDTWTATSTSGAPAARERHTAVWTGSRMIVWGGYDGANPLDTGGLYDPVADTWAPVATEGAPAARYWHTAVWTGSKMLVWGGRPAGPGAPNTNTGGLYDPATSTWAATSTVGAPTGRVFPTAVWTGSKVIVWGGNDGGYANTGGTYDPAAGTWSPTTTSGAPSGRQYHTAVWTGSRMVAWGGLGAGFMATNTGGLYDPVADAWTPTDLTGAPITRFYHTAVWTGSRMVVWGGRESGSTVDVTDTGGLYLDPAFLPPPTDFYTVTPCRLADTRTAVGPAGGPILDAGSTRSFPIVGGSCGVPPTAKAVSVNLTAVGAAAPGHLILFPGDAAGPPLVSNVNFIPDVTRANNAVVPLAADGTGTIKVKNGSTGAVHFVLDVNGYFQ